MLAFAVIFSEPPIVLFAGFMVYTLSGPLLAIKRQLRKRGTVEKGKAET
jgi:CDP-diacylglycerol--serine O-phosphatidyltransferase